jgi:predicted kinase
LRSIWHGVSFDDAKATLGLKHGENDGMAAHFAIDKAKDLLRKHEPFVWNATHLSDQMRAKTLDVLFAYDADVRLVYLEAPSQVVFQRNAHHAHAARSRTHAAPLGSAAAVGSPGWT